MTRIEAARKGILTDEVRQAAEHEAVTPEELSSDIARGLSVIARNALRDIRPVAIGRGLTTKINANIGTSKDRVSFEEEREAVREFRQYLLDESPVPVGTVPIYEAALRSAEKKGSIAEMTAEEIFSVIEEHGAQGVDFVTVHSGLTLSAVERLRNQGRVLDIVSRGGSFLLEWMVYNERENPLYEHYDRLLDIAGKYDMTLSLGDGLEELITLGELRDRALARGVQVIIEGPGHVPLNQVELNMKIQKELCKGAPFYVLGPLVTDVAMGYDHIAGAIGGAVAAAAGADFLCYVTPAEHIRLPNVEDVREGVVASKIAAHAADIAKGIPGAMARDAKMARCRKNLDWEGQISLSFNPERVKRWRAEVPPTDSEVCSMCGEFCSEHDGPLGNHQEILCLPAGGR
jgi:phosphomethylpyrimidine synthase